MPKNVNVLCAIDHIVGAVSIVESTIVVVSSKKHCLFLICRVYRKILKHKFHKVCAAQQPPRNTNRNNAIPTSLSLLFFDFAPYIYAFYNSKLRSF
jgi:hypothetical protein